MTFAFISISSIVLAITFIFLIPINTQDKISSGYLDDNLGTIIIDNVEYNYIGKQNNFPINNDNIEFKPVKLMKNIYSKESNYSFYVNSGNELYIFLNNSWRLYELK